MIHDNIMSSPSPKARANATGRRRPLSSLRSPLRNDRRGSGSNEQQQQHTVKERRPSFKAPIIVTASPTSPGPSPPSGPNRPSVASVNSDVSTSSGSAWTVMGDTTKGIRRKASGFLKDAARSWSRSKSKEIAALPAVGTASGGEEEAMEAKKAGLSTIGLAKGKAILMRKKSEIAFRGWQDTLEKTCSSPPRGTSPLTPTAAHFANHLSSFAAPPATATGHRLATFAGPVPAPFSAPAHYPRQLEHRASFAAFPTPLAGHSTFDAPPSSHRRRETSESSGLCSSEEDGEGQQEVATPTVATFGSAAARLKHQQSLQVLGSSNIQLGKRPQQGPIRTSPIRTRAHNLSQQSASRTARSPAWRHHRPTTAGSFGSGLRREDQNDDTARVSNPIRQELEAYSLPGPNAVDPFAYSYGSSLDDLASPFTAAASPKAAPSSNQPFQSASAIAKRRLRSGSSARANLFGASPGQAGGFEPFPDQPPTHRKSASVASSLFGGSHEGSVEGSHAGAGLSHRPSRGSGRSRTGSARDGIASRSSSGGVASSANGHASNGGNLGTLKEDSRAEEDGDRSRARNEGSRAVVMMDVDSDGEEAESWQDRGLAQSRLPSSPSVASSSRHGHRLGFPQSAHHHTQHVHVDDGGSPRGFTSASRRASTSSSVKGCSTLSRRGSSSASLFDRERPRSIDGAGGPTVISLGHARKMSVDETLEEVEEDQLDTTQADIRPGAFHFADDSGYGPSPFAVKSQNLADFNGFGAIAPPPDSPFAAIHGRVSTPIVGPSASRLKRGPDGVPVAQRSKLGLHSPIVNVAPDTPGSATSWRLRSVPHSDDEDEADDRVVDKDDDVEMAREKIPREASGGSSAGRISLESHDASSLNVPALTDSSSLSSSLGSSTGRAASFHEPRSAVSDSFANSATAAAAEGEDLFAERSAKRRSLPTNMGNLSMLPLANPALRALAEAEHGHHGFATPQFKNAKPSAAAFMSTGLVSKKAGRSRKNSNATTATPGAPSSMAKAVAERSLFASVSSASPVIAAHVADRSMSVDDSLAAESMREALGGLDPNVVRSEAMMEGAVPSPAPSHLGIQALAVPTSLARRTSVKSFRMPDTPVKQPAFLTKKTQRPPGSTKPLVASALATAMSPFAATTLSAPSSPAAFLAPESPAKPSSPCRSNDVVPSPASDKSGTASSGRSAAGGSPNNMQSSVHSASSGSNNGSIGVAAAKRQRLLFRRRSSDAVLSIDRSGGSVGRVGPIADEPMTPTRFGPVNAFMLKNAQLVATPGRSSQGNSPTHPPLPMLVLPGGLATPQHPPRAQVDTFQPSPAAGAEPPTARLSPPKRPAFRSRHSSSTLDEARSAESQQTNRLDTDFEVLDVLGAGEFSDAFKVLEKGSEQVFAVKRTKKPIGGPKARVRLLEEVDVLRHLSTRETACPSVIQFFDAWEFRDHLFIQTEYCENGNLQQFLELFGSVHGNLEEARIWKIVAEVATALSFLHLHGVLHLDVKPANVFLTARGGLKLGDFGLSSRWPRVDQLTILRGAAVGYHEAIYRPSGLSAIAAERRSRSPSESISQDLEREGDREYIAPEVLSGRYGPAADIFALGLIGLEAAVNAVLPDNGDEWHALRSNDLSCVETAHLGQELVLLIARMMDRDPDSRLTTVEVIGHPVISRLIRLREVGVEHESRIDAEAKAHPDLGARLESHEDDQPVDGVWHSTRGAVLPEADGFLDFILGGVTRSGTVDDGEAMDID